MDTRAYTKEKLEKLGFTVLDSRSNFLFARKPGTDGGAIYVASRSGAFWCVTLTRTPSGIIIALPSVPRSRWIFS